MTILKIQGVDVSKNLTKDGYTVEIQDVHSSESGINESGEEIVEVIWGDRHKIGCVWQDIDAKYMTQIVNLIAKKTDIQVEFLYGGSLETMKAYVGDRKLTMKVAEGKAWDLSFSLIEQRKKG